MVYRLVAGDRKLLDIVDIEGQTALHVAAQSAHPVLVRFLLDQGAAVNARSSIGRMPIDLVPVSTTADSPYYETLEVLLERGANPDGGTLLPPLARFVLELPLSQGGQDESTSEVGIAVRQAVKILVKYKADLNCRDDQGYSLLLTAIRRKQYALATLLLALGADAQRVNESGQSALHLLAIVGVGSRSYALGDQLLKAGLTLSIKDSQGKTPLDAARAAGNSGLITYLKKKGARPSVAPEEQPILT